MIFFVLESPGFESHTDILSLSLSLSLSISLSLLSKFYIVSIITADENLYLWLHHLW